MTKRAASENKGKATNLEQSDLKEEQLKSVHQLLSTIPEQNSNGADLKIVSDLIEAVLSGNAPRVETLMLQLGAHEEHTLFQRAKDVTTRLNAAFVEFQGVLDKNRVTMSSTTIPDAAAKLEHVMQMTDKAAHKTMDLSESNQQSFELCLKQVNEIEQLAKQHKDLGQGCQQTILNFVKAQRRELEKAQQANLEIVLAQEVQDLSGQVIKKTINLIRNLEESLTELLSFTSDDKANDDEKASEQKALDQSDADSVLKDLGF